MDGWMGGWMEAKAGLRIAYSNQQEYREMGDSQRLFITKQDLGY